MIARIHLLVLTFFAISAWLSPATAAYPALTRDAVYLLTGAAIIGSVTALSVLPRITPTALLSYSCLFAYLAFISITGEQTSQSLVMLGCAALGLLGFIQTSKQRSQRTLRSKPLQHHIPTPLRYRPLVADKPDTLWGHAIVLGTPRTRHPDLQPTMPLHGRKQLQRL